MTTNPTMSNDVVESLDILPMLADKFVVDFVNGIHITNDHIRVQKQRTGLISRLADGLTGSSAARQAEINANLANGVESSLKWLSELSESLAQSNYAITCVNNRLNNLKLDVAKIANYSADTRQLLNSLSEQFNNRCIYLEREVSRIGLVQRAQINLDEVFSKWEAGKYQHLALASRCYAALEELHWGAFGNYFRNSGISLEDKKRFTDIIKNKVITQLTKDAQTTRSVRIEAQHWLTQPISNTSILAEALAYLGDAANDVKHPFVYSITQQPKELPLRMPRICTAERLSEAMVHEVLEERVYV